MKFFILPRRSAKTYVAALSVESDGYGAVLVALWACLRSAAEQQCRLSEINSVKTVG